MYDILIVGGGISGLYAAHRIQKTTPHAKIMILEQNTKQCLGGRAGNANFQGVSVVRGAGVGRKAKDYLLIDLLRELRIPTHEFQTGTGYSSAIYGSCTIRQTLVDLKRHYREIKETMKPKSKTFREFAEPFLGKDKYKHFTVCAGYTDYEKEDVYDVLYYYGFEDNYAEWTGISVPWKMLIDTLISTITATSEGKNCKIRTSCQVSKISAVEETHFDVEINGLTTNSLTAKRVILATTIDSVLHLLKEPSHRQIYNQIGGQPFLRIYGKFTKESSEIMREIVQRQTIVPGPIHKIIPMDEEKGVYMIAYTDNEGAVSLRKYGENTAQNRESLCRILENALNLKRGILELRAILDFYWPIGTHYYKPLTGPFRNRREFIQVAQRPMPGMWVVGEMVALNQGWVQGALESVDAIM